MATLFPEIKFPELFIGFVAPIGADVAKCVTEFRAKLEHLQYRVVEIKVTDIFSQLSRFIPPETPLTSKPEADRYKSYISYGNRIRTLFEDDAALAVLTVARLAHLRVKHQSTDPNEQFQRTAYLIHQFKRREEIEFLRTVYGRQFFQVSVYSRRGARVDHLAHRFANTDNSALINNYRAAAEDIVQRDQNEESNLHGQNVIKVFHDADFIINNDADSPSSKSQIDRFCDLVFGSNSISPTKLEYGMFVAKAAALRTLDLSRQVGAAIFHDTGEVVSLGSNEVPKAGGGTYWCDEINDDREYKRDHDSNDRRKSEIIAEVLSVLGVNETESLSKLADTQFMDALEYGRIVHAEMSAITDAARLGRTTKGAILFCTTFPCHMCAKHIVAAGLARVVFLEPYPKSLVADLHSDSIEVEAIDRGKYSHFKSVAFDHFFGVAPRRYRELFERGKRKQGRDFKPWLHGSPQPNLRVVAPTYAEIEKAISKDFIKNYMNKAKFSDDIFGQPSPVARKPSRKRSSRSRDESA